MDNLEILKSIDARLMAIEWCFLILILLFVVLMSIRIWYIVKPKKHEYQEESDFDSLLHEKITQHMSDDLISEAKQKLLKYPKHARATYAMGIGYYQKGMYEESLKMFKELLEINPSYNDYIKEYLTTIQNTPNHGVQPIAIKSGSG